VTAAPDHLALEVNVDIVPVIEAAGDRIVRRPVRVLEALHRLVREHDAPAEGVIRAVALVNLDPRLRQGLLEEDGGVEAGRPAADADDSPQRSLPMLPVVEI